MLTPNVASFIASEVIPAGARVKLVAASGLRIALAAAADIEIGTAILHSGKSSYALNEAVGVKLLTDPGSRTCIAGGAFALGATVKRDAAGKVDDGAAGDNFGIALEAAAADGDFAEVLWLPGFVATAADASIVEAKLAGALAGGADGLGMLRVARFTLDPTALSGDRTIAAHALATAIPDKSIVVGGFYKVITTFTSATDAATIALKIEGANDIVVAIAISNGGNPWDAGLHAIIPKANTPESTGISLTAARQPTATVAVEALTAGKLVGFLYYVTGA